VARRTAAEIYTAARSAGLSTAAAVIAVAVALAESSGDDTVLGDTGIQTAQWGPSVGLWQIRTLKAQTGTGSDRDIEALRGNVFRQAQAMSRISGGGTNWSPWTMYTNGRYRNFVGQAETVATGGTSSTVPLGLSLTGAAAAAAGDLTEKAVDAARALAMKVGAGLLGLALLGVGLVYAVRGDERIRSANAAQDRAAKAVTGI
jgi:hypothetical protein